MIHIGVVRACSRIEVVVPLTPVGNAVDPCAALQACDVFAADIKSQALEKFSMN